MIIIYWERSDLQHDYQIVYQSSMPLLTSFHQSRHGTKPPILSQLDLPFVLINSNTNH